MASNSRWLLTVIFIASACADDIDVELSTGIMLKMLREMANHTKSDTLNLPANATSIRENITDTFSCENRTYGYYADVDNDCQLFHVCLPSQTPSGRNVTYRWSFICPGETIFNQEVLVCTRPIDSIPCEEAEAYYDVNDEFGKVTNDTKTEEATTEKNKSAWKIERVRNNQRRKQNIIDIRQQKTVPEEVLKDIVNEELNKDYAEIELVEKDVQMNPNIPVDFMEIEPQSLSGKDEIAMDDVDSRLASERSMKLRGRRVGRGHYRYEPQTYI